jgi:hypothetical protein
MCCYNNIWWLVECYIGQVIEPTFGDKLTRVNYFFFYYYLILIKHPYRPRSSHMVFLKNTYWLKKNEVLTWKNTIDFGETFVFLRHWISTNFPKFQSKFQKFHKISKFSKFLNFPKYKKKIQKNFTKFQNYNFFFLFLLIKFKLIFNFFPVLQKIIRQ